MSGGDPPNFSCSRTSDPLDLIAFTRGSKKWPTSPVGQCLTKRLSLPMSGIKPKADTAAHDFMGFRVSLSVSGRALIQTQPASPTITNRTDAPVVVLIIQRRILINLRQLQGDHWSLQTRRVTK